MKNVPKNFDFSKCYFLCECGDLKQLQRIILIMLDNAFSIFTGVSLINRTLANKAKPTMTWIEENGKWTQKTNTTFKSFEIAFHLGEEFDEELADGRKCRVSFELNCNCM